MNQQFANAEEYHASPLAGSSMLEDFRESRRYFADRYVFRCIDPPAPTPDMVLGTLFHIAVLEPETWLDRVAPPYPDLAPDGKKWLRRKGSQHERWWAEEVEERRGLIACTQDQVATVREMTKALWRNPMAKILLERDGVAEHAIVWNDPETGVPCKCLVDWFADISIDLKTCPSATPQSFSRSIATFGYHRKAAHYLAGLKAHTGEDRKLLHVAIGKAVPHSCAVYEIRASDLELGSKQRRETLIALAKCYDSGDWSEPHEREIITLGLPGWAYSEDSYLLGESINGE